MKRSLKQLTATFREFAMGYPDTVEDHPWGESAFKVNKKVFLFMSLHEGVLRLTTKLPRSRKKALKRSFASPTGYGLGKSGWITSAFEAGDDVPVDLLTDWIDESFRADTDQPKLPPVCLLLDQGSASLIQHLGKLRRV